MNVAAIDIGLNNFACVTNNVGLSPFIIKGDNLKKINKEYNILKLKSRYKEQRELFADRNKEIKKFMRNSCDYIINFLVENKIDVVVVGRVKNWQHGFNAQRSYEFECVDLSWFKDMLKSHVKKNGIKIKFIDEKYTSGTSFLDNEKVAAQNYDKSRRQNGYFKTKNGFRINADVNDSYQIMHKAYPNILANGIEKLMIVPKIITM